MLLRARVVYPVTSPAIDDGTVTIENGQILEVGRFQDLSRTGREVTDLGDVTLLPGFVNAHCHLDYTDMAGLIAPPASFLDWINAIISIKADWDYSDYAQSWVRGAKQLLASGATTVADIEAVPELLPEVIKTTPLRVHSFIELISVRQRVTAASLVRNAIAQLHAIEAAPGHFTGGLSPHALYSTSEELLRQIRDYAGSLTIHVAESAPEDGMFRDATGAMFDWLQRNGRDMQDCGGTSPVRRLHQLGLLSDRLLAIHCNYIDDEDIRLLATSGAHVIHCPRSHDYFGHAAFRMADLRAAGVNISLATDSLASVRGGGSPKPMLNLFRELQYAMDTHKDLAPVQAIEMVTINPARALGRGHELGHIAPGARADLITVAGSDADSVVASTAPNAVMIDGRWAR